MTLRANTGGDLDFTVWRDGDGRIIGNGTSLSLPEAPEKRICLLSVTDENGECLIREVEVASNAGIKDVAFDSSSSRLNVGFKEAPREGDSLSITGVTGEAALNGSLQISLPAEEQVSIDENSFTSGIYKVTYVRNGRQWSTSGFTVK